MATERYKVQGYLEAEISERFTAWKKQRGIEKDSAALNELLKEYFFKPAPGAAIDPAQIEEIVEAKLAEYRQALQVATQAIDANFARLAQSIEIIKIDVKKLDEEVNHLSDGNGILDLKVQEIYQELQELKARLNGHSSEEDFLEQLPAALGAEEAIASISDESPDESPDNLPEDSHWKISDRVRVLCPSNYQGRAGTIINFDQRLGWHVAVDRWWEIDGISESTIDKRQRRAGNIWCDSKEMELIKELPQPDDESQPKSLNQRALGTRFGINPGTIQKKREKLAPEAFAEWSKAKDPDAIAWQYDRQSKLYKPL